MSLTFQTSYVLSFPNREPCFLLHFPEPLNELYVSKNRELKDIHIIDLQPSTKPRTKNNTADVIITLDREDKPARDLSEPTDMFAIDDIPITLSTTQKKAVDEIMSDVFHQQVPVIPPKSVSEDHPKSTKTKRKNYTLAELRALCKKNNLSVSGTKNVLLQSLKSHGILSDE